MILFQFKVFGRNIVEAVLARYFIKVILQPSFAQLRVIRRMNSLRMASSLNIKIKYVTKIQLYLLI